MYYAFISTGLWKSGQVRRESFVAQFLRMSIPRRMLRKAPKQVTGRTRTTHRSGQKAFRESLCELSRLLDEASYGICPVRRCGYWKRKLRHCVEMIERVVLQE